VTPTANQIIDFNASESHSDNYEWFHNESKIPYKFEWHPCNITYSWDFGDGNITTVTEPMITHEYTAYGNYSVSLNITDTRNLSNATTVKINILEALHDVAVTEIKPYRTVAGNGTSTSINITTSNKGDVTETFNVSLFYDSNIIGTQTVTLASKQATILSFNWTTPTTLGNYTIKAEASQVSGETDTANNSLSSTIQVSILGDINGDGGVDMKDVSRVASAFQVSPTSPKWASNGDLDENGVIDMKDISIIAKHFGEHYP
jgi:PKD repeat protein